MDLLLVGFDLNPDGAVIAPYVRGFHSNVLDPYGPFSQRTDELTAWMQGAVDLLWFVNLGETGLNDPVELAMSVSRTDNGVRARLWAVDRETETWLLERYGEEGQL
jgi:hypothetical protein